MTKLNRWLQNYLIYGLPLVLICVLWSNFQDQKEIFAQGLLSRAAWEILSWNLMLWFVTLIIFLVLMVFNSSTREMVTRRIANIKERDEREVYITGQASKSTFTLTLTILIALLFISVFTFNIRHLEPAERINDQSKSVSIGFNFKLTDKPKIETDQNGNIIFESKDIPLSKSAILLLLIIGQITIFSYSARKLSKDAETA